MDAFLLLLAKILISLAASLTVLRVMAKPLLHTLEQLCPDGQSAAFWLSYTRVMLVIAPMMLVLIMDSFARLGNPLDSLRTTLLAALAGLLLGLHILGRRMGRFTHPAQAGEPK
ncbi:MAG: hypothetical protein KF778_00880 [Rhodocyclaceae bacterium]|nr:hypothetical protein [Rhodocyclaceae bacterium]MBX3666933.1 hypothetical protein [Rhodocyclaceae bacterium]